VASGGIQLFAQSKAFCLSVSATACAVYTWSQTCIWFWWRIADLLRNAGNSVYCSPSVAWLLAIMQPVMEKIEFHNSTVQPFCFYFTVVVIAAKFVNYSVRYVQICLHYGSCHSLSLEIH